MLSNASECSLLMVIRVFFALTDDDAFDCWWLDKDLWSESECVCWCADSGHHASAYDLVASACSTCYWSSDADIASDADVDTDLLMLIPSEFL